MLKAIGGTIGAIVVGVVTWWLTVGWTRHSPVPASVPDRPAAVADPAPAYSVTGIWTYTSRSRQRDAGCVRTIKLTMDGTLVTGVMDPCDASRSGVDGTLSGHTLELTRDTGLDTIQKIQLSKRSADLFVGTYWNVGKSPDEGTIELRR